jgi:hypothetical protein
MLAASRVASRFTLAEHHERPRVALEHDAVLAIWTLARVVTVGARGASIEARSIGRTVNRRYLEALRASSRRPSLPVWRRFVATLRSFILALDRGPRDHSKEAVAARAILDRIVMENLDLLA